MGVISRREIERQVLNNVVHLSALGYEAANIEGNSGRDGVIRPGYELEGMW